jgi:hypothetical protein
MEPIKKIDFTIKDLLCPICKSYPCICNKTYRKKDNPCYYCGKIGLHYCVMRGGTG